MTSPINRRNFLTRAAVVGAAASLLPRAAAGAGDSPRRPTVTLLSGWQTVNIGDIAHTPGVLGLLQKHLPEAQLILWPGATLDRGAEAMLRRNFPKLEISTSSEEIVRRSDLLVHGSGPSVVRRDRLAQWAEATRKPFGVYGVTVQEPGPAVDVLRRAAFVFTRETASLGRLKQAGVEGPQLGFVPDGTFAFSLRDDEKAQSFLREQGLQSGKFICVIPRLRYTPYHKIRPKKFTEQELEKYRQRDEHNAKYAEQDHAKARAAIIRWVRTTGQKALLCPEMTYQLDILDPLLFDPLPDDVKPNVVRRKTYWLPDEAASVYANARAVLSYECHSPILACAAGTPAFYLRQPEDTIKGQMWYDLGLKPWVFEIDEATGQQIADRLMEVHRDYDAAKATLAAAMRTAHERFETTMAVVRKAAVGV